MPVNPLSGEPIADQPVKGTGGGATGTIAPVSPVAPTPLAGTGVGGKAPAAATPSAGLTPGQGAGAFGNLPPGSTQASGNYGVDNPNTANATQLATQQDVGLYTVGANLINNYNNGTLPPGMMDYINQQTQESIDELTQQFNSEGIGTDNTEYASAVANIKLNSASAVAQQLNQEYANGMQAFGMDNEMLKYVETMNTANVAAASADTATKAGLIGGIMQDIFGIL